MLKYILIVAVVIISVCIATYNGHIYIRNWSPTLCQLY